MQAISLRDNQDAYYYQQATLLAYEMQDRIRANGIYWTKNSSVTAGQNEACNSSPGCSAAEMAANDYQYWKDNVKNTMPKLKDGSDATATIQLSKNVTDTKKAGCTGLISPDHSLCLKITWGRTNSASSNKSSKLSDTATHYLEVTP
jgi:Tfp pilus assembly protein PilV